MQTEQDINEKVYPYEVMLSINHPDLSNIDLTFAGFMLNLPSHIITKEMKYHYPNKNNVHFNRKRTRPKTVISNDPEVLKNLRACLSKITEKNFDIMTEKINKILSADYDWKDVSTQMYLSVIDNIFLVPIFVKLMTELESEYTTLIHHFHHLVLDQLYYPKEFTDTLSESGLDKTKRWQISNALLITEVFTQKKYNSSFMIEVVNYWLGIISVENLIPLEILIKVIPKCGDLPMPEELVTKLKEISNDKTYPNRLRLLLNLPRKK